MLEFMLEWAKTLIHDYGALGFFIVMIVGSSPIPIPIDLIALTVVSLGAPPLETAILAGFGATLGGFLVYLIGAGVVNLSGIKERHAERMTRAKAWLDHYGAFAVFFVAVTSTPMPFDAIAIAAGGAEMDKKKFLYSTLFGRLLRYFFIVYAGKGFFTWILNH